MESIAPCRVGFCRLLSTLLVDSITTWSCVKWSTILLDDIVCALCSVWKTLDFYFLICQWWLLLWSNQYSTALLILLTIHVCTYLNENCSHCHLITLKNHLQTDMKWSKRVCHHYHSSCGWTFVLMSTVQPESSFSRC